MPKPRETGTERRRTKVGIIRQGQSSDDTYSHLLGMCDANRPSQADAAVG